MALCSIFSCRIPVPIAATELLGGELIWGEREDVSGDDGYDLRAQLSLKVNFPRD